MSSFLTTHQHTEDHFSDIKKVCKLKTRKSLTRRM